MATNTDRTTQNAPIVMVSTSSGASSYLNDLVRARAAHGAGVAIITPSLLPKSNVPSSRKRGYAKPTPWPSK